MSERKYEQKELKGSMWNNDDVGVAWKGSILVDGKPVYGIIAKTIVRGEPKFEFMQSAGLLYLNDKSGGRGNSPDIGGPISLRLHDGSIREFKFGGWEAVGQESGRTYLSVGLEEKMPKAEQEYTAAAGGSDWRSSTITKPVHEAAPEPAPMAADVADIEEDDIPF